MQMKTIILTLASAAFATAAFAEDPIKIGVPVGLSGANSVVAPSVVQAAELAVEEINAKGGVLGRPLELEIADDASGAAGAQKAFDSLVFQKEVNVVISMETSAARNAGLPIISKGDVPYIYTSFYEGKSCNANLFVDAWVPEQQVPPVVDNFISKQGAKKFFLIGSDYAFGRGMLTFAKGYIEKAGAQIVGEEYLPMDGSDWTAIISKVRSSGADAIITSTAGGAPNVTLTKQLRSSGVTLPYGNLAVDEGTAKSMGADAKDIFLSASYVTGIDSPENKAFLSAMDKKFGKELRTPNDLSVPQYEAIYLYKAAVEKAGSTDTADVLKALPDVSFTGPRGKISMNKQHHAPLTMYLGQVKDGGSVAVVDSFKDVNPGDQCPNL
ncbi:substrate-binding protein [Rhizobium ruizarguesonis]|jgi:branched-chain amino acid transport system substrate-binding protein|uniref:ABC transporter substrate-binding protein n=2 Tax=Rhizobium ruizarguesonis TaxID=2081791 RepID=A0AAE5C3Y6_9HYPH|nr:substrate-binding protein [Rhizobium ruizarguesonis]MBY5805637.1 substrate-binding domain-containing protein [Rhizobium leguminosarum]NKJ71661.1 ABC transporter substrate-binding protein [Rhizobium leguminosarum bv. viciae]MBC2807798.1 substrate-binding protein [Rhizobium ruizarguesonis]MBY5828120.1 substrate-binding domain-containing protein [Rhizobium leguminosarum]MBY5842047.1 substrate-binding domain-containing protein [Rhizobium leguminosarum]